MIEQNIRQGESASNVVVVVTSNSGDGIETKPYRLRWLGYMSRLEQQSYCTKILTEGHIARR